MAAWRNLQDDELRDVKRRLRAREPAEFARMCAEAESLVLRDRYAAKAMDRADEALSWVTKPCSNRADEVARRLTIRWLRGDAPFLPHHEPFKLALVNKAFETVDDVMRPVSPHVCARRKPPVGTGRGLVPDELVRRTCERIARELGAKSEPEPFKPPHRPQLLYSVEDIAAEIEHTVKNTQKKIDERSIPVGKYFGWTVAYRDNLGPFKEYKKKRREKRVQQELRTAA
jgi:hypothetical protein